MTHANKFNPFGLTHRECEIMKLLVEDGSNRGVASALGIHESTVACALHDIMTKLSVSNRVQAVILWERSSEKRRKLQGKRPAVVRPVNSVFELGARA